MEIIDCIQGSDRWHAERCGRVTASCFKDVMNKKTGRNTYMMKVLAERLTGETVETYKNAVMDRGNEVEPEARAYYEAITGVKVEQVGFVARDEYVGVSPDGFIGDKGMLEIKCPNSSTHVSTIISHKFPTIYVPQVQGQLVVCKRDWCDFMSYDPRVKDHPSEIIRVNRDISYCVRLEAELEKFIEELKTLEAKIAPAF